MDRRSVLVAVSAAQLTAGIAGQQLAIRRGLVFDIALIRWRGRPDRIVHDRWLIGTSLSAPMTMLATQAGATAWLATRPSRGAERLLGGLGAVMLVGYTAEREFRRAVAPRGWDSLVTPVALAGAVLAGAMAALVLRGVNSSSTSPN